MKKECPEWFIRADNRLLRVYKYISYIAACCLIAIMFIAVINVIGEKLAKAGVPISGISGYSNWISYLHVPIVFLTCGYVTIERGHTCVDILAKKIPRLLSIITYYVGMVLGALVAGYMCYRGITVLLVENIQYSVTISDSSSTGFPQWPFTLMYCIGMAMLSFSFIWMVLRQIFNFQRKTEEDEQDEPQDEPTTEKT